jgi:hypothetical protein
MRYEVVGMTYQVICERIRLEYSPEMGMMTTGVLPRPKETQESPPDDQG